MTGPIRSSEEKDANYIAIITEKVFEYLSGLKSAPKVKSPDDVVIDAHQTSNGTTFVQFTVPSEKDGGQPYTDVTHFTT